MSTEETTFLDGMAAELTGGAALPEQIDHDNALPEALAADVEQYDAYAADRDAHLVQDDEGQGDQVPANQQGRKQVPLTALQEERQRRQQRDAELAQERANNLALRQQFDQALAQQQAQFQAAQQQAQQRQIPAFEEDPQAHVEALAQQVQQLQAQQQFDVRERQFQQAEAQAQYEGAQLQPQAEAIETEFSARVPDYREAFDHMMALADARIAQQYPGVGPREAGLMKQLAVTQFFKDSVAQGVNPAEKIYAKARELGFQSSHRVPGQQRIAAPTSLSSLPAAGGAEDGGRLTAAKVNAMSDAEFAQLVADMKRGAHAGPGV